METNKIDVAETIFRMIKNLSAEIKLELISKITDSLKGTKNEARDDSWRQ
ncbi:MAG TPA: hypothetical protein VD884_20275 [Ohtaekwangia sp.]|nr:hypothetical protein [Ohtaekwangia sp.]